LHGQGRNNVIDIGVKACIGSAVNIEPGDTVSGQAANGGKTTADEDLAVILHDHALDKVICVGVEAIKGRGGVRGGGKE
jgi:hypothetical protein